MTEPIDLTTLDFSQNKDSLKAYLQGQDRFKDYNFDGSNLQVLLDILTYNTVQNAFYVNMAIAESFIDTAQLKDSIVSHAKELNYIPQSRKSSVAVIDVTITPTDNPMSVIIPKGTEFRSVKDGEVFTFTTSDDIITTDNNDGTFTATGVEIREGKFITDFFQVDTSQTSQRFVIENNKIDIDSLTVDVKPTPTDLVGTTYTRATGILGLTAASEVFFLQGYNDNKYEIVFGNDITSKALINGNLITAVYRISRADEALGAKNFKPSGTIQGYSNIAVTTVAAAQGGGEREDIESIRFTAPRYYQTQERAVTANDYITLIKRQFNSVQDVNVFGGETLSPPQFGRVAISIDLFDVDGVSSTIKQDIIDYISTKSVTTITPIIIDPDFIFFEITGKIKYDINKTSKSSSDISTQATAAIEQYNIDEVNFFNSTLKYSRLNSTIDNSDPSIISSSINVRPFVKLTPADVVDGKLTKTILFSNQLDEQIALTATSDYSRYDPIVRSTTFKSGGLDSYIEDDGAGLLQLITTNNDGDRLIVNSNIGSVDYTNGTVDLVAVDVSEFKTATIDLYVRTENRDVVGLNNTIISIDSASIKLDVVATREE